MKEIKIKYFDDELERLHYIDGKSDWIDLRAAEDTIIQEGEFKLIPLGVAMQLPEGYEAHVAPRSSTFKNYGLVMTNSVGVVDASYCGSDDVWFMPVYCLQGKEIINGRRATMVHKNDRICQFRIMKNQPQIQFEEVKELSDKNRGGHGSTGVK